MPGLGKKSVTIMLRTGFFAHGRSRWMKSKTNTLAFRASVTNSFLASMQTEGLRLPTFDEVLAVHKDRTGCNSTEVTAVSASSGAPDLVPEPKRRRLTGKAPHR